MSDVERPFDNGGAGAGNEPGQGEKLPARNMADIARLFLDGARPNAPRRSPPKPSTPKGDSQQKSQKAPEAQAKRPLPHGRGSDARGAGEAGATAVLGLAAAADAGAHWKMLTQAAQGLAAEQATSVALVGLMPGPAGTTCVIDVVGVESTEELPVARTAADAAGQTTPDLQMARALHRMRPAVGLWIIAGPAPESRAFPAVASIARQWLLACPTDNDGLVASYQLLKQAFVRVEGTGGAAAAGIRASVFLLADDYAHAAVVHKRLRKAAQEFLRTELALAGAGPIRGAGHEKHELQMQPPIRVLSLACVGPEDALWAALLDELCPATEGEEGAVPGDIEAALEHVEARAETVVQAAGNAAMAFDHLAQVLDPEERDALTAGLYDVSSPEENDAGVQSAECRVQNDERGMENRELRMEKEGAGAVPVTRPEPPVAPSVETRPSTILETARAKAIENVVRGGKGGAGQIAAPAGEIMAPAGRPVESNGREPAGAETRNLKLETPGAAAASDESKITNQKPQIENSLSPSLRALDLPTPTSRGAQWEAVERSIWDLSPKSALLDAKPPMSWATETCIAIDKAGRLNVWTLYKESGGAASWFALREWAREHKKILALTRRDLVINAEGDVAVHIVLPLEDGDSVGGAEGKDPIPVLVRTSATGVHLYRLRTVQWDGRQGIIVVPVG